MRLVNVGQTSGVKHLIVGRRRKFHIADGKDAVLRHCNRFSKDILGLKIAVVCEIVAEKLDLVSRFHLDVAFSYHAGIQDTLCSEDLIFPGLLVELHDEVHALAFQQRRDVLPCDPQPVFVSILVADRIDRDRLSLKRQPGAVPVDDHVAVIVEFEHIVKAQIQIAVSVVNENFQFRGNYLVPAVFVHLQNLHAVLIGKRQGLGSDHGPAAEQLRGQAEQVRGDIIARAAQDGRIIRSAVVHAVRGGITAEKQGEQAVRQSAGRGGAAAAPGGCIAVSIAAPGGRIPAVPIAAPGRSISVSIAALGTVGRTIGGSVRRSVGRSGQEIEHVLHGHGPVGIIARSVHIGIAAVGIIAGTGGGAEALSGSRAVP